MSRSGTGRGAVAAVLLEGILGRLAFGIVSFALPLYGVHLGLGLAEIGVLVSLRTVAVLPLKPLAGWISDRIGVRPVYLFGAGARVLAAVLLIGVGDFAGLAAVRVLQGASAAGRDVASLAVIVRDARTSVGTVYGWYATAKHVGGVAGAAVAGVLLTASGGSFGLVFGLVAGLSVLPLAAAAWAIHDPPAAPRDGSSESPAASLRLMLRELRGPAGVGMLVAAGAYMVHGLFPVLATEHAGLSPAEAGAIYALSAVVFVIAAPSFGWLIDRHGRLLGLAWRSIANVGSSLGYLLLPSFGGYAIARALDDSGKAAFRPAWASAIAGVAEADPPRRSRRVAALDTAENVGEAIGPALAGLLWQTGGIALLVAGRIAIALVAELVTLRVFSEWRARRPAVRGAGEPREGARVGAAYLAPPTIAAVVALAWLHGAPGASAGVPIADTMTAAGLLLAGLAIGSVAGGAAQSAQEAARAEEAARLAHDVRGRLAVIRGEVEVLLADDRLDVEDRAESARRVIAEVERASALTRENGAARRSRAATERH